MLLNKKIPLYYVVRTVRIEHLYVIFLGLTVHYFSTEYKESIPPMPIAVPAFIGTAISILLSFKLNQSYDRWWEARKIWGSIVNDSRSLVIKLQSFVKPGNEDAIRIIAYRQIAWCYCLGQSLRKLDAIQGMDQFLSPTDVDQLRNHSNKPLAILQKNALDITELREKDQLDIFSHNQICKTVEELTNSMGGSERINSTVFPTTYRIFLHLSIYIFVVTLCIALRDVDLIFEMPLLIVLSSAFFLLEKSAAHLQDPFVNRPTDTPMTTIARTIEINIKQLLGESNIPPPFKTDDFYIL